MSPIHKAFSAFCHLSFLDRYSDCVAEIDDLAAELRAFADKREWAQFHTVRNLILALAGEVGELAAEVQWIPDDAIAQALDNPEKQAAIESEMADVASYIIRISDVLQIDLGAAIRAKLALNESRYPADLTRGNALKYNELNTNF
jgi:NTP pyrophosphatase (non-canonical NTP hydrolase)